MAIRFGYKRVNKHFEMTITKLRDLLRAIRNKRHHQRDLTEGARAELGTGPDTFWDYFDRRYPLLLSTVYKLFSIPLADEGDDVNFVEFYECSKSAQITARLVKAEIEAEKRETVSVNKRGNE